MGLPQIGSSQSLSQWETANSLNSDPLILEDPPTEKEWEERTKAKFGLIPAFSAKKQEMTWEQTFRTLENYQSIPRSLEALIEIDELYKKILQELNDVALDKLSMTSKFMSTIVQGERIVRVIKAQSLPIQPIEKKEYSSPDLKKNLSPRKIKKKK